MGRIGMSQRELRRVEVLARVKSKELKVVDAASLVGVSYRQAKRLWKRYREQGAKGLRHRGAGRVSARAKPGRFRWRVMKLVREKYGEGEGERFGPTLAAEHLASEDGMRIDAETLRRWMLEEGLWRRRRKRKPYRQRRERRRHFGELVQMDGSFHDWLEERGPQGCMMNMTDDATSEVELRLGEEETIWAAANTLRGWIEKHGVPQALYVDWKNVYKRAPTQREQLRGEEPVTQFGGMCEKLGIEIIAAGSPQAKGRVERNHGTHQDRLIKKMRRKKIRTHEQANVYLQQEYLPEHNERFRRAAAEAENYHRQAASEAELREVFRLESERVIGNDWVVRYDNRWFQVQAQSRKYAPAQGKVVVCEWQDGTVEIEYRGRKLPWKEIFATGPRVTAELKPRRCFGLRPALHPKRAAQNAAQGSAPTATRNRTKQEQPNAKAQKGDISNEVRMGTF
ncbi:MAG: ISNCY-like element ISTde1 family transposase [Candidatus Acidiferrum sp.]